MLTRTPTSRGRGNGDPGRWNGPPRDSDRPDRRQGEDAGRGRDPLRCHYERFGQQCCLPGTLTNIGAIGPEVAWWCWWHVEDQRGAPPTREEWEVWQAHPVTREVFKHLSAKADEIGISTLREIAQDPAKMHRASYWEGYEAGIKAWREWHG